VYEFANNFLFSNFAVHNNCHLAINHKPERQKTMQIRKAKIEDSETIARYMMLAMKDIVYNFIGENSMDKAMRFLVSLISRRATQYSYEHCWVLELNSTIVAAANIYDGALLQELRLPVAETIKTMFDRSFCPADETQTGEFYIDCLGVHPDHQGKGLGSILLGFLINEYVQNRDLTVGLLVDTENPMAKKFYLNLGFEIIGEKELAGKKLEHLQIKQVK
jgi:ribosomal protein S18 acetylase RimI-like enzyme